MLLAYHGVEMDGAELRHRCKTREFGTYARDVVACARELGFTTSQIPYVHTVVVEDYEAGCLLLVDPNTGPWEIRVADFLEAWEIHGNMALVLRMEAK